MSELGLTYSKSFSLYIVYHTHVLNSCSGDGFWFSNSKRKSKLIKSHYVT